MAPANPALMLMPNLLLIGAAGRMGKLAINTLTNDFSITTCHRTDNLAQSIQSSQPNLALDFSGAHSVFSNVTTTIQHKVPTIIGSSGLTPDMRTKLTKLTYQHNIPVLEVPNFAISIVIFAQNIGQLAIDAQHIEINETHGSHKLDKPSGTATYLATIIQQHNPKISVNIISHRQPDAVAKHTITIQKLNETITLSHQAKQRNVFQAGIRQACTHIISLPPGYYLGLEHCATTTKLSDSI